MNLRELRRAARQDSAVSFEPSEVAAFVSMVETLRLLEREMEQASRGKQGDYVADWLERVRAVLHDFEAGS